MSVAAEFRKNTINSYKVHNVLAAIQEMTQEEFFLLKKEMDKKIWNDKNLFNKIESANQDSAFFLFGKWPDFEDAETLRKRAWKRNSI